MSHETVPCDGVTGTGWNRGTCEGGPACPARSRLPLRKARHPVIVRPSQHGRAFGRHHLGEITRHGYPTKELEWDNARPRCRGCQVLRVGHELGQSGRTEVTNGLHPELHSICWRRSVERTGIGHAQVRRTAGLKARRGRARGDAERSPLERGGRSARLGLRASRDARCSRTAIGGSSGTPSLSREATDGPPAALRRERASARLPSRTANSEQRA